MSTFWIYTSFLFFKDTATTEIHTSDTLFPYTTLFRSGEGDCRQHPDHRDHDHHFGQRKAAHAGPWRRTGDRHGEGKALRHAEPRSILEPERKPNHGAIAIAFRPVAGYAARAVGLALV